MKENNRNFIIFLTVLALIVVGLGVFILKSSDSTFIVPQTAKNDSSISLSYGNTELGNRVLPINDAEKRDNQIDIYLDYQCSFCAVFENESGATLNDFLNDREDISVNYHIMNFLNNSHQYSSRSANASLLVAREAPDKWYAYNDILFKQQPDGENVQTHSNEELVDFAKTLDVNISLDDMNDKIYHPWINEANNKALEKVDGTPNVFINGEQIDTQILYDSELFLAELEKELN